MISRRQFARLFAFLFASQHRAHCALGVHLPDVEAILLGSTVRL